MFLGLIDLASKTARCRRISGSVLDRARERGLASHVVMTSEQVRNELRAGIAANPDAGVSWRPADWQDWVPVLKTVPADLIESERITKKRLYEIADDVANEASDELVAGFLIAVQAWGSGIKGLGGDGRGPWRAACGLGLPSRSPDSPLAEKRIQAIRDAVLLSRSDVKKAWRTLYYGEGHISKWGEPFFTKVMHAAGYEHSTKPWPLILDKRVRDRLDDVGHPVGSGISGYLAYLDKAHGWAKDWGITPAHVEYALFHRSKHL